MSDRSHSVRRHLAAVAATIAALFAAFVPVLVGSGVAGAQGSPPVVAIYGDSLVGVNQSGSYINILLALAGYRVIDRVFAGTSPCNWMQQMEEDAQSGLVSVAVLAFSGDAFGCMDYPPESPSYYAAYRWYTTMAAQEFANHGIHTFITGSPVNLTAVNTQDPGWDHLDEIYAQVANGVPDTTFVNAGASVENASQQFVWTLPCLFFEPYCGPGGKNVVKEADGAHFCPLDPNSIDCGDYSSGGLRYALAVVGPVENEVQSGSAPAYVGPALPPSDTPNHIARGQIDPYYLLRQDLTNGQTITTNMEMSSLDRRYRAVLQSDGNFVVYAPNNQPVWSTNTVGTGADALVMQTDGNAVLYAPSGPVWATNTAGTDGLMLALQDNGQLVLYGRYQPLWGW